MRATYVLEQHNEQLHMKKRLGSWVVLILLPLILGLGIIRKATALGTWGI